MAWALEVGDLGVAGLWCKSYSFDPVSAMLKDRSRSSSAPFAPSPPFAPVRGSGGWVRALVLAMCITAGMLPAKLVSQEARSTLGDVLQVMTPREIGPAVMGGRVADLAVVESDPDRFYVGFASAGVWLTENAGSSWTPLFDDQPCASIGDVTVFQANPNVVWAGTGEPQNRQSSPYGCGVFKSVDGGRNWHAVGLTDTRHVSRIALHPGDPDVAYVAAVGHLFGPNPERGVFRTLDGGDSWERVLYVDDDTGAIDLIMDPSDPRTLFAAMYQRRRTAFGFSASGAGSGLYRTLDGGDTWTELTTGLPEGDKGRIGIDVYRRDGNLVYALVESRGAGRGLYRSRDRGDSWEKVSDRNPRPMYFSMVRIDPSNPERIYLGGVSFSASDDGGSTWWDGDAAEGIHVDHHALWINPANSRHIVLGNDGGIALSRDGARTWRHVNNMAIGQFYEIGVDMSDPYRVCGGLQDNSSWCAPNETRTDYGLRNGDWFDVWGGDGFYNQFDPANPDILYTESQGGNSGRVNLATGESLPMRPTPSDPNDPEAAYRWNWNSPIVVSRHPRSGSSEPRVVYVASNHLHRSLDGGESWEEASPDLTRAIDRDTLPIMGALVTDSTLSRHDGQSQFGTITTVSESPLAPDVLYVGTDDGNLQVTRDGGMTWTNVVANIDGVPDGTYVSRVEASHHSEGRVYATFDGHWSDDYRPYVFVSGDYGENWMDIAAGLPDWSVNVLREHPLSAGLLFLGNEMGVFVSVDGGGSWHRFPGLPTVPVDDMTIHPRDDDLVIGTHGRSIWIVDDLMPLRAIADGAVTDARSDVADATGVGVALFDPPAARLDFPMGGWPFAGDVFEGMNPPSGAAIRYWLGANEEGVKLDIRTPAGAVVRELDAVGEAGAHLVVWNLREDAPIDLPSGGGGGGFFGRSPQGPLVLPGTYLVRLEAGNEVVESELRVEVDARVTTSVADLRARQAAAREAALLTGTSTLATRALGTAADRVREARSLVAAGRGGDEDTPPDAEVETAEPNPLVVWADSLEARIDSLNARLNRARPGRAASGIERHAGEPTPDQMRMLDLAWEMLPGAIEAVNRFLADELVEFLGRIYQPAALPRSIEAVRVPVRGGM